MTNSIDLKNKNVLVTGGGRGIGAAICRCMAACGANLLVNYYREPDREEAERLVQELKTAHGVQAFAFRADISDEQAVEALYTYLDRELGVIDVLVNNAGTESVAHAIGLDLAEWDRVVNTNLRGSFICAQQAGRRMVGKGGGVIINISSMHDSVPRKGLVHYCVAKAGLAMLTKCLALELAEYRVRVVGVAPGAIETEMNRAEIEAFGRDKFDQWIPLGRVGNVEEVAWCCAFLASGKAGYITGTTLYVDGAYKESTIPYDSREKKQ